MNLNEMIDKMNSNYFKIKFILKKQAKEKYSRQEKLKNNTDIPPTKLQKL